MSRLRANRASLEESFYVQFSMAQSTLAKKPSTVLSFVLHFAYLRIISHPTKRQRTNRAASPGFQNVGDKGKTYTEGFGK